MRVCRSLRWSANVGSDAACLPFSTRLDTESTYDRLKWFSIATMLLLITLGVYQVLHMRSFLKKKKAI